MIVVIIIQHSKLNILLKPICAVSLQCERYFHSQYSHLPDNYNPKLRFSVPSGDFGHHCMWTMKRMKKCKYICQKSTLLSTFKQLSTFVQLLSCVSSGFHFDWMICWIVHFVQLLSSMSEHVFLQSSTLTKWFLALCTLVWLLSTVKKRLSCKIWYLTPFLELTPF